MSSKIAEFAARGGAFSEVFNMGSEKDMDIRSMLESTKSTKDNLSAMKKIVASMAGGGDVQSFFPSVVKQVVSSSMEMKKLVYLYLVRYAEVEQDLALMSVNTFQKDLQHSNPFIRASALRVMTSIRVQIIAPLMMLAVQSTVSDMSPYVRKVAAHSIPKIYSLDPSQKDPLIDCIEKLLNDKSIMVLGSACMAFEIVCPDRFDLLHKIFRKLVQFAVDIDEWGQVAALNLLTRYGRSQFLNPNQGSGEVEDRPFYSDEEESSDSEPEGTSKSIMDNDHRYMLSCLRSLLYSQNSAVIMSVAKMFYYLAPYMEAQEMGKVVCRLLSSHKEITHAVLANIETMSMNRPEMFSPHAKSFFVRSGDAPGVKLIKIKILTNLISDSNAHMILKELMTYAKSGDKEFSTKSIESIGKCATAVPDLTESCLLNLMSLLSSTNEEIVGMSIVVMKVLLQIHPENDETIIRKLAKMYLRGHMKVAQAQASVIWLCGEYALRDAYTEDVLRIATKNFVSSDSVVKLQVLTLSAKLFVDDADNAENYLRHILNMAKYDLNYDVRDRARFLEASVFVTEPNFGNIMLNCTKPTPQWKSKTTCSTYTLGSLSHLLGKEVPGYEPLPDFPDEPSDPALRQIAGFETNNQAFSFYDKENDRDNESSDFYSSSGSDYTDDSDYSSSEGSSGTESETDGSEGSDFYSDEDDDDRSQYEDYSDASYSDASRSSGSYSDDSQGSHSSDYSTDDEDVKKATSGVKLLDL